MAITATRPAGIHCIHVVSGQSVDQKPQHAIALASEEYRECAAHSPFTVPDVIFARIREVFDEAAIMAIMAIIAIGTLMVATNILNNALGVPLDEYLEPYRREER